MASKFPLIKRLGIAINIYPELDGPSVSANALENTLAEAQTVYSGLGYYGRFSNPSAKQSPYDTHEGLVVGIQPIKRDSADDLLRDFFSDESGWLDRAKAWVKANPK